MVLFRFSVDWINTAQPTKKQTLDGMIINLWHIMGYVSNTSGSYIQIFANTQSFTYRSKKVEFKEKF